MVLGNGEKGDLLMILSIDTDMKIKNRLQDMGLTRGVRVRVMGYYANNALIINIRGSRVVIAKEIAENIQVELIEKTNVPCRRRRMRNHHAY